MGCNQLMLCNAKITGRISLYAGPHFNREIDTRCLGTRTKGTTHYVRNDHIITYWHSHYLLLILL